MSSGNPFDSDEINYHRPVPQPPPRNRNNDRANSSPATPVVTSPIVQPQLSSSAYASLGQSGSHAEQEEYYQEGEYEDEGSEEYYQEEDRHSFDQSSGEYTYNQQSSNQITRSQSQTTSQPKPILKKSASFTNVNGAPPPPAAIIWQKTGFCTSCGTSIVYTPVLGMSTRVQCHHCFVVCTFPEDLSSLSSPNVKIVSTASASPSGNIKSNTDANSKVTYPPPQTNRTTFEGSMSASSDSPKSGGGGLKMKGAFKAIKAANSTVTKMAKEKGSQAASMTKSISQKAATNLKTTFQRSDGLPDPPKANAGDMQQATTPAANPSTQIFGIPLEEAIRRSAHFRPDVPDVVSKCVNYLWNRGIKEEGIFRLSGSVNTVKDLKAHVDAGNELDLAEVKDEHVVTGLLKLYFRELPDPIFSKSIGGDLRRLEPRFKTDTPDDEALDELSGILSTMPECNRTVLDLLLQLLVEVVANQSINKMSFGNLSIVFSPTLGCPIEIMTAVIQFYDRLFGQQQESYY